MKLRRWTLRTNLLIIVIIAVPLGLGIELKRRSDRYWREALRHSTLANSFENRAVWGNAVADDEVRLWELVHFHDGVAARYFHAASRPWLSFSP